MTAVLVVIIRAVLATDNEIDSTSVASSRRGSCRASGLCCQGKNNTCRGVVNEEDMSVGQKQMATTCFCDTACLEAGDCCDDYAQTCQREFSAAKITYNLGSVYWA